MRIYKFKGEYTKLKDFGYNKFNILSLSRNTELWGKVTEDGTIVVSDYVSVKLAGHSDKPATTSPSVVYPFINDLIKAELVKEVEKE